MAGCPSASNVSSLEWSLSLIFTSCIILTFTHDQCRAIAAVLLGDPEAHERIPVTLENRFQRLHDRNIDALMLRDGHIIEREVKENTTGAGFAFSTPYYYDGMAYLGMPDLVQCAENRTRYGNCSKMMICVRGETYFSAAVIRAFPPDFIYELPSHMSQMEAIDLAIDLMRNGTCNVAAAYRSELSAMKIKKLNEHIFDSMDLNKYRVGEKMVLPEPQAIVTRNSDREFSDIINWVVHALYYGEEQGLTKDLSLCRNDTNRTSHLVSDLNFMNAVYCVGNYGEIFDGDQEQRGMNQINDGTSGMIYGLPLTFGPRGTSGNPERGDASADDLSLHTIKEQGNLTCGVVIPVGFTGDISESDQLVGMNADYCRTLAAALFNGDPGPVELVAFHEGEDDAYASLNNGTIGALAGARVELKYDFGRSSLGGVRFSTPYYYGNETASNDVSAISLATREDDKMFSSFVNCIVSVTFLAAEKGIGKEQSMEIPKLRIFGRTFLWSFIDAIFYSGTYDDIYRKNFGNIATADRGRNNLNREGGPQMHSFPGY